MRSHKVVVTALMLAMLWTVLASRAAPHAASAPEDCPTHGQLPRNLWSATKTSLLPRGAASIRACRYEAGGHALKLKGSDLVTRRSTIAWITRKFDELPAAGGVTACPNDNGSIALAIASYRNGYSASVRIRLTACRSATNTHLTSNGLNKAGFLLVHKLEALTR